MTENNQTTNQKDRFGKAKDDQTIKIEVNK